MEASNPSDALTSVPLVPPPPQTTPVIITKTTDVPPTKELDPSITDSNIKNDNNNIDTNVVSNEVAATTNDELDAASAIQAIVSQGIPAEAKRFAFGSQVMIIGLNTKTELNKKLGFVVGDYKKFSKRIPVRLITNSESSKAPTYLLKINNLQFVSQPIPGYDVEAYETDENQSDDNDSDLSDSDDSDNDSSSSSESSLTHSISNLQSMNLKPDTNTITIDDTANDEDDDIKINANTISDDKLQRVHEKMVKYYDIMQQFNKPETIDLSPSITSTKSLPIDCGLRWEPKPVTESIENLEIVKIGSVKNIINDLELVIESVHSPQTVITFDSVLCLSDHTAIGRVDDIFGAVKKPYYFVRLTVDKAILLKDKIALNQDVFAVKPLSNFVIPPQTDERYSSESDCGEASTDDEYGPNTISNKKSKRAKRAMSVDREILGGNQNRNRMNRRNVSNRNHSNKRKYFAGNNYFNHNKRQRYSAPYAARTQSHNMQQQTYAPYYYQPFNPLPTAIPPPQLASRAISQTATMFRPQVNIIPSPPANYINTMNQYNAQSRANTMAIANAQVQAQVQQQMMSTQMVQPQQQQQQQQQSGKISVDPFSFGVIKKK